MENKPWTKPATLFMIESFRIEDIKNDGYYHKKNMWKSIAAMMRQQNYDFSEKQCCDKMKALKKRYRVVKDNNRRSGAAKAS